jgi:hypothetical protein
MNIILQPANASVVYARSPILYKFGALNTGETYKYQFELRIYTGATFSTGSQSYTQIFDRKYDLLDGTPTITVDVSNLVYTYLRDNLSYDYENIVRINGRLHEYNNGVLTVTSLASYPWVTLGYVEYVEQTTTTTTTIADQCLPFEGDDMYYDEDDPCGTTKSAFILRSDTGLLSTSTIIYAGFTCSMSSLADAGYYRQGGYWRYWNGLTFTGLDGYCYPETGTTTTTTTTAATTTTTTTVAIGFLTEWTVTTDDYWSGSTIFLPTVAGYNYDATVYWGDSTSSHISSFDATGRTHTYANSGTYQVNILGTFEGWSIAGNDYIKDKITKVLNFGGDGFNGFKYLAYGFATCYSLTSIGTTPIKPSGSGCTDFTHTFGYCPALTSIPTDLFRYHTYNTSFAETFVYNQSLVSVPADLFRYNTLVTTFKSVFDNCPSLINLPNSLFRYNTLVTTFGLCFSQCGPNLIIPQDLFWYNPLVTSFRYAFQYGQATLNSTIFSPTGETSSRFLNQSVDFYRCFITFDFNGTQGTAPELWNYNYGTGTPTSTQCFAGTGNSTLSLTNYTSIPIEWK